MARFVLCFTSTLLLLFVGSCRSKDSCTGKGLENCINLNKDKATNCIFHQTAIKCMADLHCPDGSRNQMIVETLTKDLGQRITNCPGLPEGICYTQTKDTCIRGIPYKRYWFPDTDAKACLWYKGKIDKRIDCLKDLRKKCVGDKEVRLLDDYVTKLGNAKTKCGL